MEKNVAILEDNSLLDNKVRAYKHKKSNNLFYFSCLFISTLLILNLYFIIKLINYIKNRDIQFLKHVNISNKNIYNLETDEGKEQDIIKIKLNNINESINYNKITFETIDLNNFKLIENKIKKYIELTKEEQEFFHGLIRVIKPKKIVEIGAFRGGSTAIILNAIKDMNGSKLYSIDKMVYCYKDSSKKTGYLIPKKFPELYT